MSFKLCLWGTFRLFGPDGTRVEIPSRKGKALLAMLGTAPDGERTRGWLQDRLWGSRQRVQAQQSLRRELASLRACLPNEAAALITSDRDRVRLDLTSMDIDSADRESGAAFLEGFDIPGEEGFEDWLREQRQIAEKASEAAGPLAAALPRTVVDVAAPAPGFGGRPAIAVLPFVNASDIAEGDFWAEGMTEDLIERLSRLRWLPVIAPATVAELSNRDLNASAIGGLVGAAYVLRGRLARRAGVLALHMTLLDGLNGQMLWSERIGLPDGVTQAVLEEQAHQLVATLEARIDTEEQARVINRRVEELNYNEVLWRARWHLNRLTRDDARIARELLAQALEMQPNSADVLIQCAFAKAWDIWSSRWDVAEIQQFRTLALRAVAADGYDGRGYMLAGMAEMWLRNFSAAAGHYEEALRLNPSLARAYAQLGSNYYLSGQPELAFEPLRMALRLSPLDNQAFYVLGEFAIAHTMLGQYQDAVRHADLSIARRPAYFFAHVIKTNALVRDGKMAAAKRALKALYQAKPGFQPTDVDWIPFGDARWPAFLKEGLVLAESG